MRGIPDFVLTYQTHADPERQSVTCDWKPNGVVRATETIQLPTPTTLMAMVRVKIGANYNLDDIRSVMLEEQNAIVEALAMRVALAAQHAHWRWSTRVTREDVARFRTKVTAEPAPKWAKLRTPCLIWTRGVSVGGNKGSRKEPYGSFWVAGATVRAHVFAGVAMGTANRIPHLPGMHLDHLCNRTLCVESDHLESVTQTENEQRKLERLSMEDCDEQG